MLAISGLSVAKITSSLMVITSDGQKINLGLSLKFEAKGLKVLDYSRKDGKNWEFSEHAIQLIQDYKARHSAIATSYVLTMHSRMLSLKFFECWTTAVTVCEFFRGLSSVCSYLISHRSGK
jgi:hypothetical protein